MRCYFMRAGRIAGVTFLKSGSDDALIHEAERAFEQAANQLFDGFEVWDGTRFIYRSDRANCSQEKIGGARGPE